MKLCKLVYLLDRLSLRRRGVPVVGGRYVSMRNGPLTSEVLDLINGDVCAADPCWSQHISDRADHKVGLKLDPGTDSLSENENKLIAEIWSKFGPMSQWGLVKFCHANCPEWHSISSGCHDISDKRLLKNLGIGEDETEAILAASEEDAYLHGLLG